MNKGCREFIEWAKMNNWNVLEKNEHSSDLNAEIASRYRKIPIEYLDFLKKVNRLISPNEKSWFLCEDDYNNDSGNDFKWNEFELLSLEAAEDDEQWKSEITSWWNNHFPILISVDGAYAFYAIDLQNDIGAIVKGYEPEFEDVDIVASSIEEFFESIMQDKIEI